MLIYTASCPWKSVWLKRIFLIFKLPLVMRTVGIFIWKCVYTDIDSSVLKAVKLFLQFFTIRKIIAVYRHSHTVFKWADNQIFVAVTVNIIKSRYTVRTEFQIIITLIIAFIAFNIAVKNIIFKLRDISLKRTCVKLIHAVTVCVGYTRRTPTLTCINGFVSIKQNTVLTHIAVIYSHFAVSWADRHIKHAVTVQIIDWRHCVGKSCFKNDALIVKHHTVRSFKAMDTSVFITCNYFINTVIINIGSCRWWICTDRNLISVHIGKHSRNVKFVIRFHSRTLEIVQFSVRTSTNQVHLAVTVKVRRTRISTFYIIVAVLKIADCVIVIIKWQPFLCGYKVRSRWIRIFIRIHCKLTVIIQCIRHTFGTSKPNIRISCKREWRYLTVSFTHFLKNFRRAVIHTRNILIVKLPRGNRLCKAAQNVFNGISVIFKRNKFRKIISEQFICTDRCCWKVFAGIIGRKIVYGKWIW